MLVLFFLLSILEDVGYMARIAFIMDRIFRRFGLSGNELHPHAGGHRLRRARPSWPPARLKTTATAR